MDTKIKELFPSDFPSLLKEIPDAPKKLYTQGDVSPLYSKNKILAVVGSRKATAYGRDVVEYLLQGLKGYPITIVSGLALGIDSHAHKHALENGLQTIAIPGSGLDEDVLYPRSNIHIAKEILKAGGALMSEYSPTQKAAQWTFPQRNRLMVGVSHAVLVIEASPKSGTLITARLATEYNRELCVVPGSIFAHSHKGSHQFLKLGATPIIEPKDILEVLGFDTSRQKESNVKQIEYEKYSQDEQKVLKLLQNPLARDELLERLPLPITQANIILSKLELEGVIVEKLGKVRLTQI